MCGVEKNWGTGGRGIEGIVVGMRMRSTLLQSLIPIMCRLGTVILDADDAVWQLWVRVNDGRHCFFL